MTNRGYYNGKKDGEREEWGMDSNPDFNTVCGKKRGQIRRKSSKQEKSKGV